VATYYEVLGVDPGASPAELQRAYRARALEVHPDTAGDDDEAMRALNEAWQVLRVPEHRARYDREVGLGTVGHRRPDEPAPLPPPAVPALRLTLWMVVVAVLFLIFVVTAYAGHVTP
jgi:curved DNA-binding protein CbpA